MKDLKNCILKITKIKVMKSFNLSLEIECLDANDPLEAAKILQKWLQDKNNLWAYYVKDNDTGEVFSVDLQEEDADDAVIEIGKDYKSSIEK